MSKWYGKVGFANCVETEPGVWKDEITEHPYYGDVLRKSRGLQNGSDINDDITVNVQISIVADSYATQNIYAMRYIEFHGANWEIAIAEPQFPRIILTLGGMYNGTQIRPTE